MEITSVTYSQHVKHVCFGALNLQPGQMTEKGGRENKSAEKKKVPRPTSSQALTRAKTAITSRMPSVCFTSIAFQSLLPRPWDIGRIFHSTVEDWHWVGKGGFEVEDGEWSRTERGKRRHLWRGKKKKHFCFRGRVLDREGGESWPSNPRVWWLSASSLGNKTEGKTICLKEDWTESRPFTERGLGIFGRDNLEQKYSELF